MIAITLGVYSKMNSSTEQARVQLMQQNMKKVYGQLYKLNASWKYEEGCRGNGKEFGYEASSCQTNISVQELTHDSEKWQMLEKIIDDDSSFINKKELNKDTITYSINNDIECKLYYYVPDSEVGFYCRTDSKHFYFTDISR